MYGKGLVPNKPRLYLYLLRRTNNKKVDMNGFQGTNKQDDSPALHAEH